MKFSDVSYLFLFQTGGLEVTLEKTLCDLYDPSFIRAVSPHADETFETELVHKTVHSIRIVLEALAFENCVVATLATSSLVFVKEVMDGCTSAYLSLPSGASANSSRHSGTIPSTRRSPGTG